MQIQINSDRTVKLDEAFNTSLKTTVSESLKRFQDHVTRVEVHLSDETLKRETDNDKRCLIEVRMDNMQPIAVTSHAGDHEKAVKGALEKIKTSLTSAIGKMRNY